VGIVIRNFRFITQGVGNQGNITFGIVFELGDIADIGTWPINRQYLAVAVVGPGCRAGNIGSNGGIRHRLSQLIAISIIGERSCLPRPYNLGRQR
jgi:hypothetical protein